MCHQCFLGTQASHFLGSSPSTVVCSGGVCYITTVPLHTRLLYPGALVARLPGQTRTQGGTPLIRQAPGPGKPASCLLVTDCGTLRVPAPSVLSPAALQELRAADALLTDTESGGVRLPFEITLGCNLRERLSACLRLEQRFE